MGTRTKALAAAFATVVLLSGVVATAGATSNHLGIEAEASDAEAGGETTVTITFSNNGDEGSGFIVDVTDMPDGWEIENHSDDGGNWNDDESKWLFQRVGAGDSVEPTVTISIPEDASGENEIEIEALDNEDNSATATATVDLGSEEEEDGEGDGEDGDDGGSSGVTGPGFGAGLAVLAILGAALLALRRQ